MHNRSLKVVMTIDEIRVLPVRPQPDGLIGFLSFVYRSEFYMGNIAVYRKKDGDFRLVYPGKKVGDRTIQSFHPISYDVTAYIDQMVLQRLEDFFN